LCLENIVKLYSCSKFLICRDIDKYNCNKKPEKNEKGWQPNSDVNSVLVHYVSVLRF
jgi:hypothetical protein